MALLVMGWNLSAPGAETQGTPTRPAALCVAARQSSITHEKHNGLRRCGGWRLCSIIPNFICWGYLLVASAACKGRDGNELGWSIPPQLLLGYVRCKSVFPRILRSLAISLGAFRSLRGFQTKTLAFCSLHKLEVATAQSWYCSVLSHITFKQLEKRDVVSSCWQARLLSGKGFTSAIYRHSTKILSRFTSRSHSWM